jgi:ribonuclease HepT-like protein
MDAIGLTVLLKEIEADCAVIQDAARKAQLRLREDADGRLEACAYELTRLYNIFERTLERICRGFENHFDKQGDYHERLIQRLALALPGIRPEFIPKDAVRDLRELKGFRHVVRHAYDLEFREDRLVELAALAARLASQFPLWAVSFGERTRAEQGWNP